MTGPVCFVESFLPEPWQGHEAPRCADTAVSNVCVCVGQMWQLALAVGTAAVLRLVLCYTRKDLLVDVLTLCSSALSKRLARDLAAGNASGHSEQFEHLVRGEATFHG